MKIPAQAFILPENHAGDNNLVNTLSVGQLKHLILNRAVLVNCTCPGMIWTDMLRGVNQDEVKALAQSIPIVETILYD